MYLEHPATRSSMPGDVRRCPQPTISVDRTRLVSFSVRKTSLGSGHCDVHCAGARSFFVPMIMFRCTALKMYRGRAPHARVSEPLRASLGLSFKKRLYTMVPQTFIWHVGMLACPSVSRVVKESDQTDRDEERVLLAPSPSTAHDGPRASYALLITAAASAPSTPRSSSWTCTGKGREYGRRLWRRLARVPETVAGRPACRPLPGSARAAESRQGSPGEAQQPSWGAAKRAL